MYSQLKRAKKKVEFLDQLRLTRAMESSSETFQQVLQLISLLLHCNHPRLPGYVKDCPTGITYFKISPYQEDYLYSHGITSDDAREIPYISTQDFALFGIYLMGSISSISQTPSSDLDIWLCHNPRLTARERGLLQQKTLRLQVWAKALGIDISLYLVHPDRFRHVHYSDALTDDNSGSAQNLLLLEEFYRSAIRLAGKPLLWLHINCDEEKQYDKLVAQLIVEHKIDPEEWVDFGGLGEFSAGEYFGATLWQLYKGIDSPYKSVLKVVLLESYSFHYPNTYLIAQEFKKRLLNNELGYHFDAYLCMLERVTNYLSAHHEAHRLDFVRRCFYIKVHDNQEYKPGQNWRLDALHNLVKDWGWSDYLMENLNNRVYWKVKRVKRSHNDLIENLMISYRNLIQFARKHKVTASIMPKDMLILSRKLYTAFEELPGKVTLLNSAINSQLGEADLTFIQVKDNKNFKAGWYLVNQPPKIVDFSGYRHTEYAENLTKLVAWAYFNGLLTSETRLHIVSDQVSKESLYQFTADLSAMFPNRQVEVSNKALTQPCEIKQLLIAVNLTNDPTKNACLAEKEVFLSSDLFSLTSGQKGLIDSIDLIYRNGWGEIRTLHFEGQSAILRAIKILSNKIYPSCNHLEEIEVFSYSEQYQEDIHHLVYDVIERCIGLTIKNKVITKNHLLRIKGENWQKFFTSQPNNTVKTEKTICKKQFNPKYYPYEMDSVAHEGFLQFFFEDNPDGSFNVYILDERNCLEIYHHCDGKKEEKMVEINDMYQSLGLNGENNLYRIVQHHFNYPQFYQLLPKKSGVKIIPFHSQSHSI